MEFDPGHTAFSYPSRPCKLDRSISWTKITKSPIQYSSNNGLDYDYGGHSQTMEFFDMPSMFEDALRQLTSSPCFAYPPESFQTNSPLPPSPAFQNTMVQTELLYAEKPRGDPLDLDMNNYQDFWDTALSLDTQQDFSSHLWPTLMSDDQILSSSSLDYLGKPLELTNDISRLPSYQIEQSSHPSSIVYSDPHLAIPTLDTIYEELGGTTQTMRYVIVPSSLPDIDEFDRFGRKILLASDGGHSGNITLLLDKFLTTYSYHRESDYQNRWLNNLVAYGFLNLRDGSYDLLGHPRSQNSQRYISKTVHDQIRLLAAEGLEPAEKIVFSELDNINKQVYRNKHARMIIGIFLLRLMLLYRDRLVRDDTRLSLPRQKKCQEKLPLQYDDVLKILLPDLTKQQKTKKRRKTYH
ncbi:hypothetical protein G7Y89_g4699 [Cudoniella acicularis]|uniref:Uncharacterized protein n=1 Tax=Cudoniella acicularis TaxID=354080 RepID=A0A8H4W6F2_9HELO|nr:hypothetical protein G7Y89_g4699 [Cudoniella acicularis]